MTNSWWVGSGELDHDQSEVISLPLDDNALVTGPPGSGKTNLLLLRANYLFLSGYSNIAIVTFTRALREFIAHGADNYSFPADKIMTSREWQIDLIRQYGGDPVNTTGKFEDTRKSFISSLTKMIKGNSLSDIYDALLLDEAQDYSPAEIELFSQITPRLFCVADERQKIYEGEDSISEIRKHVDHDKALTFHYRNGYNICRVADEVAKKMNKHEPLVDTSNYDESENPSTVDIIKCQSIQELAQKIIQRISLQLISFPGELIGVLCPTRDSLSAVWGEFQRSSYGGISVLMTGNSESMGLHGKNIVLTTFHASKGLEFRALHLAMCEELKTFGQNRRMAFTAITRAKTSLSAYHILPIHGYLESALNCLGPQPDPVHIKDIFGGKK